MSEEPVRLNRFLAGCGYGSRRFCDGLIAEGRVAIDGKPVSSQGERVFPSKQSVTVDGKPARSDSAPVVLMVHKPRNILCTVSDPEDRRTIMDLVPEPYRRQRLFPVGRLDRNSEGLILLTNDGDLAHRLTHPRYHVEKEYLVWVRDEMTQIQGDRMLRGVKDEGERLAALDIQPLPKKGRFWCYSMVLGEGRNRHIRRMCEAVGVSVARIKRIRLGPLDVKSLPVGQCRELHGAELAALRRQV